MKKLILVGFLAFGALGIKVWIFHGEVLTSKKEGGEA